MQTTTNPPALSIAPAPEPAKKGFGDLPCPKCGEECSIKMDLDDMHTCTCRECENEFTLDDVRTFIRKWTAVLKWVETCPSLPAE